MNFHLALLLLLSGICPAANIGFFYALDKDSAQLQQLGATRIRSFQVGETSIQEFSYESHRIFAVKMGSGSVQTCLSAQALLCRQKCDIVFSVGPIGGLTDGANIGRWYRVQNVVAWQKGSQKGEQFVLHQNAVQKIAPFFEAENEPSSFKNLATIDVASGEVFVASDSFRTDLSQNARCAGVEMNLFGLLSALDSHNVKGIHLRIVSDLANSQASETFQNFVANYDGKGAELILQMIDELPADKTSPDAHDALRKLLKNSPEKKDD